MPKLWSRILSRPVAFCPSAGPSDLFKNKMNLRTVEQQIRSLGIAAVETAPLLRPLPNIWSLLGREPSLLDIFAEIFDDGVENWASYARTAGVCSFCYERLEEDEYDARCIVPEYEFNFAEKTINLTRLRVGPLIISIFILLLSGRVYTLSWCFLPLVSSATLWTYCGFRKRLVFYHSWDVKTRVWIS